MRGSTTSKFATGHRPKGTQHCGNQVCVTATRSLQRSVGARTGLLQPMVTEREHRIELRWAPSYLQYGVTDLNGSPSRYMTACWPYFLSMSSIPVKSCSARLRVCSEAHNTARESPMPHSTGFLRGVLYSARNDAGGGGGEGRRLEIPRIDPGNRIYLR